jgi:hypothetical protein
LLLVCAATGPLALICGSASCILEPPPQLSTTLLPATIATNSTVPPTGVPITEASWPTAGFTVPIEVYNGAPYGVVWAMIEDDGQTNSIVVTPLDEQKLILSNNNVNGLPGGRGGFLAFSEGGFNSPKPIVIAPPNGCHTFTFYAMPATETTQQTILPESTFSVVSGAVTCDPYLCASVSWSYWPSGDCPSFDAGRRDAGSTEASEATIKSKPLSDGRAGN